MGIINIDGHEVKITNPEKILWRELGIRKIDYIQKLIELAPYIISHAENRLLTTIRYPDGVNGKSFYQKNLPNHTPAWVDRHSWKETDYINLNHLATLVWLGNQAALELHTSFNLTQKEEYPTSLVFDLDPSKGQIFNDVIEVALLIHDTLISLEIKSFVKTSGATGLQIYIPLGGRYDYNTARKMNKFFASYFEQKYPKLITIERTVSKRNKKLYFDYLQMWQGKTIITAYSPRATANATVSMPIQWDELKKGIKPEDFTLLNVIDKIKEKGDLFEPLNNRAYNQHLGHLLKVL